MTTIVISAGVGPWEVRNFVGLLSQQISVLCQVRGLKVVALIHHGDEDAPRSVRLDVKGDVALTIPEIVGTHVLIASSPRRERRGRKRWFAGVSFHASPVFENSTEISPADVQITTARAGGPGGQHVNTTDSAVRVRHKVSGLTIRVTSERSQHRNRAIALKRLAILLAEREQRAMKEQRTVVRHSHYTFERGSAVAQWKIDSRSGALYKCDR